MTYNRESLKKEIMDVARQFASSCKTTARLDYQQRLQDLKPGDTYPVDDGFVYTAKYRDQLKKDKAEAVEFAKGLIENYAQSAQREMVAPPDSKALAYINSMKSRKVIGVDEMAEAFMQYGNNWTCYQMLTEIRDEQRKVNWKMSGIQPVHSLDGYNEVGAGLMKNLQCYLNVFSSGAFKPDYISSRLETLENMCDIITETHGEVCPDINQYISRVPSHVETRAAIADGDL